MTPEEHKAIARRFFEEVWNTQNLDAIDDIFAATVLLNGQRVARDAFREDWAVAEELGILQQLGQSFT